MPKTKFNYIASEDQDLTGLAKEIFGSGIVIRVWEVKSDTYNKAKGQKSGRKVFDEDLISSCVEPNKERVSIRLDPGTIWIEFSNGNIVKFTTSEWGTISKANREGVLILDA